MSTTCLTANKDQSVSENLPSVLLVSDTTSMSDYWPFLSTDRKGQTKSMLHVNILVVHVMIAFFTNLHYRLFFFLYRIHNRPNNRIQLQRKLVEEDEGTSYTCLNPVQSTKEKKLEFHKQLLL